MVCPCQVMHRQCHFMPLKYRSFPPDLTCLVPGLGFQPVLTLVLGPHAPSLRYACPELWLFISPSAYETWARIFYKNAALAVKTGDRYFLMLLTREMKVNSRGNILMRLIPANVQALDCKNYVEPEKFIPCFAI